MGTEQLQKRRMGRPRGGKNRPAWHRDILWAYRNLGSVDAEPPSALAGLLHTFGREQPDKLAAILLTLDATGLWQKNVGPQEHNTPGDAGSRRRLMKVHFRPQSIVTFLAGRMAGWIAELPRNFEIVDCTVSTGRNKSGGCLSGVILTIRSAELPEVPEGEPIPEVSPPFGE